MGAAGTKPESKARVKSTRVGDGPDTAMLLPMTSMVLCAAMLLPRLPQGARRAEAPKATEAPAPKPTEALADLRGALLNEEEKVTVTYSGSEWMLRTRIPASLQ